MKYVFLIFAIIASVSALPVEKKNETLLEKVSEDLQEYSFKFFCTLQDMYQTQADAQAAIKHIIHTHYEEFEDAWKSAYNTEETSKVLDFFEDIGFSREDFLPTVFWGLNEEPTAEQKEALEYLMKDLQAIPVRKFKAYQKKLLKSSTAFKEFYDAFYSEKAQDLFKKFLANPQVDKLIKTFEKYGIPYLDYNVLVFKLGKLLI